MRCPVHPKTSKKKDLDFLTINYGIVLSSVLFGYGTFICINRIDIIVILYLYKWSLREKHFSVSFTFQIL